MEFEDARENHNNEKSTRCFVNIELLVLTFCDAVSMDRAASDTVVMVGSPRQGGPLVHRMSCQCGRG